MTEWLLDCEPRAVQLEALRRSMPPRPKAGWCHFMEMRLGKTPTALNEFLLLNRDHGVKYAIVISPNTYKDAWVKEAVRFGVHIPFLAHESRFATKTFKHMEEPEWGLVFNYEALRSTKTQHALMTFVEQHRQETLLIVDESIKIKNPQAQWTKFIFGLAIRCAYTRCLSGRPTTQGPQDLYSQLKVAKGPVNNFYGFRNRFCKMGGYKMKQVVGAKNEEELREILEKCAFIAKRKDWGTITDMRFSVERITPTPEQQSAYKDLEDDFMTILEDGRVVSADQVITKLMKQQQVSSGFVYDENGKVAYLNDPKTLPKMERTKEILEELEGKAIVCFHHQPAGDILLECLRDYRPACIRGRAWMRSHDRDVEEEKRRFNEDPECRVMLLNLDAGKYGHTLTGSPEDRCAAMLFYENTFSLDTRSQIEMRPTASEQDWEVMYFDFVSTEAEARPIKALIKKEDLVTAVLGDYGVKRWSE